MRGRAPLAILLSLATCRLAAEGQAPPAPVAPPDGAVLFTSIPHFEWSSAVATPAAAMPSFRIQVARDGNFDKPYDEDRLAAVIRWYVPDRELEPGDYAWRVAVESPDGRRGPWSAARRFCVRRPDREFRVAAGSSFAAIRDVLRRAATSTPARVVFEKAEYRLDPGGPNAFIDLDGVSDLTVDGGGSTIVLTRAAPLLYLVRCRRVLVKGFAFDFDPPVYTAGRIVSVDAKAGAFDMDLLPGHARPDSSPVYARDGKGMVVTEADGFAIKRGVPLVFAHSGFEPVGGVRFRVRLDGAKQAAHLAPGDVYILGPRWLREGGGGGVHAMGGSDVVLFDLAIRGAANECLGSFYSERHAILRTRIERAPGRALSVNNGGHNHHNARTGPWIEGCHFENTGDDICHVNGYAMGISTQPAPDRITLPLHQPYDLFSTEAELGIRVGDRLQFFLQREGRILAERRVERVARSGGGKSLDVTLDAPLAGLATGPLRPRKGHGSAALENTETVQVYDASRGCNQFVFRNNTCRNGRRVGVLAKGEGGLIENNRFEGLGGGGVEFWNAPFEGLAASDYVVRNNRILDGNRLKREDAPVWLTIFKSGGPLRHRNILVEGNEIAGADGPAILMRDTETAVLRSNRVSRMTVPATGKPAPPVFELVNTRGVSEEGNEVTE